MFFIEEVVDWEHRISGYSTIVNSKYKTAFARMNEFLGVLNDDPKTFRVSIQDK